MSLQPEPSGAAGRGKLQGLVLGGRLSLTEMEGVFPGRGHICEPVAISGAPNRAGLSGVGRIQRPSPRSSASLISLG